MEMIKKALMSAAALVSKLAVMDAEAEKLAAAFQRFMKNPWEAAKAMILTIDRVTPFNPTTFFGYGWSIWRGPADRAGRRGEKQQDGRSLALTEVDFSKILLETCLREGESKITGEEKLRRLKASGRILLDARIGQALYREGGQKTLRWLHDTHGITYVDFMGTELRGGPYGYRYVLCLYRGDGGSWYRNYDRLADRWFGSLPSAVSAS